MRVVLLIGMMARIAKWVADYVRIANPVIHSVVQMTVKPNIRLTICESVEVDMRRVCVRQHVILVSFWNRLE
ncbi:hypothetical protein D3C75_1169820 [compost metagenome]